MYADAAKLIYFDSARDRAEGERDRRFRDRQKNPTPPTVTPPTPTPVPTPDFPEIRPQDIPPVVEIDTSIPRHANGEPIRGVGGSIGDYDDPLQIALRQFLFMLQRREREEKRKRKEAELLEQRRRAKESQKKVINPTPPAYLT